MEQEVMLKLAEQVGQRAGEGDLHSVDAVGHPEPHLAAVVAARDRARLDQAADAEIEIAEQRRKGLLIGAEPDQSEIFQEHQEAERRHQRHFRIGASGAPIRQLLHRQRHQRRGGAG